MKLLRIVVLLLLGFVAIACGEASSPAQEAGVVPTPTPVVVTSPEATAAPAQESEAATTPGQAETEWLTVEGKTEENLNFLGNPEAPVTLIDYSDFL